MCKFANLRKDFAEFLQILGKMCEDFGVIRPSF